MQHLCLVNKGRLADSDRILADLQRSTVVYASSFKMDDKSWEKSRTAVITKS